MYGLSPETMLMLAKQEQKERWEKAGEFHRIRNEHSDRSKIRLLHIVHTLIRTLHLS